MRVALLAVGAVAGWLVWRRRGTDGPRVVVAWPDGTELVLRPGTTQHGRLVALAEQALR